MNENKLAGSLGLCRKANKMSIGHDASKASIVNGDAKLCILASDASERLKEEFSNASSFYGKKPYIIQTEISILEFAQIIGTKAGVVTVNDNGFATIIKRLFNDGRTIDE